MTPELTKIFADKFGNRKELYDKSFHETETKHIKGENTMLNTTGYNFEGYTITQYLDVISASVVLGTGFLSSFSASIADISGTRSGSYERKLEESKNDALNELKEKALHLNGNAIIGIDIDYTTFGNDIMGVIVSGTVVKIEKNVTTDDMQLYSIPVFSYNVNLPFNICKINFRKYISSSTTLISLDIQSYFEKGIVDALIVDIELQDVFKERFTIQDVMLRVNNSNIELSYSTEFTKLEKENIRLDLVQKSFVNIKKMIIRDSENIVQVNSNQYIENNELTVNELINLKNTYGNDVVVDYKLVEDEWICHCGAKNKKENNVCYRCNREMTDQNTKIEKLDNDSLSEIKQNIYSKNTATEIYTYVKRINDLNKLKLESLVYELQMISSSEIYNGNLKEAALNMVKKFI